MDVKIKEEDVNIKCEPREEVITKSNIDIVGEDVVREHCYVGINTKRVFFYHLSDHNYFNNRKPQKPAKEKQDQKQKRKRTIKITELRAVYNCKTCGYRTMNRETFSQHDCSQKPKYVPCNKCDKNTAPVGYQKCSQCSYFTRNKSSLKVHMRIHAKGTPYKCTECQYSGKDLKDLIIHYEETKDLKCDCGYTTHVKQQMATHKRSHLGDRPFSCGICSFSSADRSGLHRHLKKHEMQID